MWAISDFSADNSGNMLVPGSPQPPDAHGQARTHRNDEYQRCSACAEHRSRDPEFHDTEDTDGRADHCDTSAGPADSGKEPDAN